MQHPKESKLTADFLSLRFIARRLQRGLQLLDLLVQVFLPLRQLAQPVEHLPRLTLLRLLLRRGGRALLLVAVLFVGQLQLIQLLLRSIAAAPASSAAALLAADDVVLAGSQLQQRLIRGLLG